MVLSEKAKLDGLFSFFNIKAEQLIDFRYCPGYFRLRKKAILPGLV
jgi:hypothetical protein